MQCHTFRQYVCSVMWLFPPDSTKTQRPMRKHPKMVQYGKDNMTFIRSKFDKVIGIEQRQFKNKMWRLKNSLRMIWGNVSLKNVLRWLSFSLNVDEKIRLILTQVFVLHFKHLMHALSSNNISVSLFLSLFRTSVWQDIAHYYIIP